MNVSICDGKYTVIQDEKGGLKALRYGEEWRDCCGDNLIYNLAYEVSKLREKINEAKNCLVCSAVAPATEVCKNTLEILND